MPRIFWGMQIPAMWHYTTGAGKTIAMIDTGIGPFLHPDLLGWQQVSINNEPLIDEQGHGTHQAGAIGAARDGQFVVGAAYGAERISIRHGQDVYDLPWPLPDLPGAFDVNTWRIREALDSAYARGADVISMALSSDDGSNQVSDKIEEGYSSPVDVLFLRPREVGPRSQESAGWFSPLDIPTWLQ